MPYTVQKLHLPEMFFVYFMYRSNLHKLWHHQLCHGGQFATSKTDKVADGIPSLCKLNSFFSCHNYSSQKMTAQIKGHNKEPNRATQPGKRFNMYYRFVRGVHTTKTNTVTLITSKVKYNCYLLIVDEYILSCKVSSSQYI